jgi:serine/threonine protein phosphatase 1
MAGHIYFAIGDVHGEADKLGRLHDAILDRIAFEGSPARIVHLGDFIDRGPNSRGVIERVMALEKRFASNPNIEVISLRGNHEQMLLDALAEPEETPAWLTQGLETLDSYAGAFLTHADGWRSLIPQDHRDWMANLPVIFRDPARRLVFVHAGIEPDEFPNEDGAVYLWTRSQRFFDPVEWPEREELKDLLVVHGHTPVDEPELLANRINVDTGACFGGYLTAVMLKEGQPPQLMGVD